MNDANEIVDKYSKNIDLLYQLHLTNKFTKKKGELISKELGFLGPQVDSLVETDIDAIRRMLVDPRPAVRLEGARKVAPKLPAEARATYLELRKLETDISISAYFALDKMDGNPV